MAPAQAVESTTNDKKGKKGGKLRWAILGVLAAAYVAGAAYFSSHFTPGTTVDGVDASLMTVQQLADAIQQRAAAYEQHITGAEGLDVTIRGTDVTLTCDGQKAAQEALDRTSAALWLPYLISPKHMLIDANVTVNDEALANAVGSAIGTFNETATPPTNATAAYNAEKGVFEPTQESVGTALDAAKVLELSTVAMHELRQDVTVGEEQLAQPAVTNTNETLLASIDRANNILAHDINVVCDDQTIATIDRNTMAGWMKFTPENQLEISGIYSWVENNEAIVNAGNATDDEHVWELDTQGTCDDIHRVMEQDLGDSAKVIREAIETKPPVTPGAKERGRHIDINITTQFVRFYDSDGKVIWDSYCVTGGYDPQYGEMHSTPTGTFAIQAKQTNTKLIGADRNGDNEPDYESFVYFWMPFLNYDYGLHDATWRSDFGGEIRTWYGSHGCVNLPYEKAAELFELVNVGDTVYVHE